MNRALIFITLLLPISISAQTVLGDPNAIVYSMDIEPQSKLLVALLDQKRVELWNYENQTLLKSWELDSRGNSVAIANNTIVVAKSGGIVEVYNALTFEKTTSQNLTQNISFSGLKMISGSAFVLTDVIGNVYKSDSENGQIVFNKIFTAHEPITQLDFIADRNVIITFHATGKIFIWTLDGDLLNEQQISEHTNQIMKSSADESKICATFKSGKIHVYSINSANYLNQNTSYKNTKWPVSLDYEDGIIVVGTTKGSINIYSRIANYKARLNVIVNVVRILPDQLPKIILAVGTHGGGIRIMSAIDMKMN